MRKILTYSLILFSIAVALCSCGTAVRFTSLVPSEINLSGCKTIAFAQTKPYRSWFSDSGNMYEDTAHYVTNTFQKALDQGVYNIVDWKTTQAWIDQARSKGITVREMLRSKGVDIIITSEITHQDYEEDFFSQPGKGKDGKMYEDFYCRQKASIEISYKVQDVRSGGTVDSGKFKKDTPFINPVYVGSSEKDSKGPHGGHRGFSGGGTTAKKMFEDLIDTFAMPFKKRLTPYSKSTSLYLKESKDNLLKPAYEAVDNGEFRSALEIFRNKWEESGDITCAYNCIILYAATTGWDYALEFARDIYNRTYNEDIAQLLDKMNSIYNLDLAAKDQINGNGNLYDQYRELEGF